jgi:hypothetical protein
MKTINFIFIALGLLVSAGISIYAAQPWGDNYAYQDISGYFGLLIWELWIGLPFLLLYWFVKKYKDSNTHMRLLLFASLVVCVLGNYIYVESIVFSSSSTSALVFIFLPLYQLIFLAIVGAICALISKSLNKTLERDAQKNARRKQLC